MTRWKSRCGPNGRSARPSSPPRGCAKSKILTAEGEKQSRILRAEGDKLGQILRAEGQSQAIGTVFQAVHRNDADSKVLAYQYLQTLPQLAQAEGNTFWVMPSEVTTALKTLSSAFGGDTASPPAAPQARPGPVTGPAAAALAADGPGQPGPVANGEPGQGGTGGRGGGGPHEGRGRTGGAGSCGSQTAGGRGGGGQPSLARGMQAPVSGQN